MHQPRNSDRVQTQVKRGLIDFARSRQSNPARKRPIGAICLPGNVTEIGTGYLDYPGQVAAAGGADLEPAPR
ncbi:MAG: hypothetical protein QOG25_1587, partial [Acetobacteraceae bacterium]|nr:hypothetical protein [Acetobacteraceae bacterium]